MIRNSRGSSTLVELVVAAGFLGFAGLMGITATSALRSQPNKITGSNNCRNYLDSAFARIQRFGTRMDTDAAYSPRIGHRYGAAGVPFTPPMYSALNETAINVFPANFFSTATANPLQSIWMGATSYNTELNSAIQISGSVHLLQSIVRANANACASGITWFGNQLGTPNSIFPAPSSELMLSGPNSFQLTMNIAGLASDCASINANSYGPMGAAMDPNGNAIANVYNELTPGLRVTGNTTTPQIVRGSGLRMTLTANYFENGTPVSCSRWQDYEYDADITAPDHPIVTSITPAAGTTPPITANLPQTSACNNLIPDRYLGGVNSHLNISNVRVDLIYDNSVVGARRFSYEPGTALFCRDVSYRNPGDEFPCRPIADATFRFHNFPQIGLAPDPAGAPANPAGQGAPGRWTPCERVTLCGKAQNNLFVHTPTLTAAPPPAIGPLFTQTLSWSNLPYGCKARLRVIAVDSAGNLSFPMNWTMLGLGTAPVEQPLNADPRNNVDWGFNIPVPQ